jgi:glycosyltransferase involved in cell wall biosynthesis
MIPPKEGTAPRMRIGFDGLSITARPAGSGGVALALLAAMAWSPRAPTVVAVLPEGSAADAVVAALPNVEVIRAPFPGPDTPRALWFQHATMPRLLRAARIDVHVGASFVLPLRDVGVPSVVIVHDVSWRLFPETKSRRFRAYMDRVVPRSIRRAHAVVTGAESARREILEFVPGTAAGKVRVVPWGVTVRRADGADAGVPRPYLLAVSNFDRRKNLPALVAAWRHLSAEGLPHALVLAGDPDRAAALRREVGADGDERLVTPGYVGDARLAALYRDADLVVVPSVYEGFGLPVAEAFAAGAPVACSNVSSLPEVAGDAAVLFDPHDVADIARAIREALVAGPERDARVRRGRTRAAALSWERAAERVLDALAATSRRDRA